MKQTSEIRRLILEYLKEVESTNFLAVIFYCKNSFERPRESDIRTTIWNMIGDGTLRLKDLELSIKS